MFALFRRRNRQGEELDWKAAPLFLDFSEEELERVAALVDCVQLDAGQHLVREGSATDGVYIVTSGELEVTKREARTPRQHRLKRLVPGDVVGELESFDRKESVATVTALRSCRFVRIRLEHLRFAATEGRTRGKSRLDDSIRLKLIANLATHLAIKLRHGSEDAIKSAHRRTAMGELIVNLLTLLCGYVLFVAASSSYGLRPQNTMFVSLPMLAVFGFASWRFMRNSGYPLSDFGLTTRHLLGSLGESILITVVFLVAATGIKWGLIRTVDAYADAPLFEARDIGAKLSESRTQILMSVYAVSSAVQELIVRGALQSMLERFLTGPYRQHRAVIVCGLLFSVSHIHTGASFPLLVLFPALVWGWLFARRRNLIGVTLSHVILGCYVFFILGVRLNT